MRGVFLDRDGVINVYRRDYVKAPDEFEYYDTTRPAFRVLARLGLPTAVVTNQSGIARGYQSRAEVDGIHERLARDALACGLEIGSVELCPHLPQEGCRCRKPEPELFERAAARLGVDLAGSYLVGDSPGDMAAGRRLSMVTLRVATGRGAEEVENDGADEHVADLLEAAQRIAAREEQRKTRNRA